MDYLSWVEDIFQKTVGPSRDIFLGAINNIKDSHKEEVIQRIANDYEDFMLERNIESQSRSLFILP